MSCHAGSILPWNIDCHAGSVLLLNISRHAGSLLLFTDSALTPKLAPDARLAWREMGESMTTAKRALQIGRYQLQRLHLDPGAASTSTSFDIAARADRLDSAVQSPYVTMAKFFLMKGASREMDITSLLQDVEMSDDDAPSVLGSGSAASVSVTVSEVSGTGLAPPPQSSMRVAPHSYAPPEALPPARAPARQGSNGSLAARSISMTSSGAAQPPPQFVF